jgi:hypothetical protein
LISRACRIWQTLHVRLLSGSLSHSASTLRAGVSAGHFDECGRSTGGRLSFCFAERCSPQCLPPLASPSRRSSAPHPKMRRFRSATLHKLQRSRASMSGRYPQVAFRRPASFRRSPRAFYRSLLLRISLSTDSFEADRFNESCKIDASVISCLVSGSKAGSF